MTIEDVRAAIEAMIREAEAAKRRLAFSAYWQATGRHAALRDVLALLDGETRG